MWLLPFFNFVMVFEFFLRFTKLTSFGTVKYTKTSKFRNTVLQRSPSTQFLFRHVFWSPQTLFRWFFFSLKKFCMFFSKKNFSQSSKNLKISSFFHIYFRRSPSIFSERRISRAVSHQSFSLKIIFWMSYWWLVLIFLKKVKFRRS